MLIRLVLFDLDDTLAMSKSPLMPDMAAALERLLATRHVAVISGTKWELFRDLFIANIDPSAYPRLLVAPVSGAQIYRHRAGSWCCVNSSSTGLGFDEVRTAFERAFDECGFVPPSHTWGPQFEDRVAQVTYSALGQLAPPEEKRNWDPDHARRQPVIDALRRILPGYVSIRAGGTNSIDVSGFEKDYGIKQLILQLLHDGITEDDALFIGDAIHPGGNDYAVTRTNVRYCCTESLGHTKRIIQQIIDDEAAVLSVSRRGPSPPPPAS